MTETNHSLLVSYYKDVKIYNIAQGKTLHDVQSSGKSNKSMNKDPRQMKRVELVQDFHMPNLSTHVTLTPDGTHAIACGSYPPTVKIFDLANLSCKHTRGFNSLPLKAEPISQDWTKFAVLGQDKTIDLQGPGGNFHKITLPRVPRDIKFDHYEAMLYCVGDSHKVFRLDLEIGCFAESCSLGRDTTINCVDVNNYLNLIQLGTADGSLEAWDARASKPAFVHRLHNNNVAGNDSCSVEKVASRKLNLIYGDEEGCVKLFDVRSPKPVQVHDQEFVRLKTNTVGFHQAEDKLFQQQANQHFINVVDFNEVTQDEDSSQFAKVDHQANQGEFLSHVQFVPDSGLIFTAGEGTRMGIQQIPQLGKAPKFARQLEAVTEELEEGAEVLKQREIFEGMTFVDKQTLSDLGALDLVGSAALKPHMHGFFLNSKLQRELRAKTLGEEEKLKESAAKEKLQKKQDDLIHRPKKTVNDNQFSYLEGMKDKVEIENDSFFLTKRRNKKYNENQEILTDDRFKDVFNDQDFTINKKEVNPDNEDSKESKVDDRSSRKEYQSDNNDDRNDQASDKKMEKIYKIKDAEKLNKKYRDKSENENKRKRVDRNHTRTDVRVQLSKNKITKLSINKRK